MRYGSVCSGIEAASVAWAPLGWTPEFFSEIDQFPCEVLAERHGSNLPGEPLSRNAPPNLGDMTKFKEWPDAAIDVLVGGTPCQAFSVAGLRKGLADPRGNLTLTYLGILDRYRPTWMVWENVPGVLSSAAHDSPDQRPPEIDLDGGNGPQDGEEVVVSDEYDSDEAHAFACFISGVQELGYGLAYRVLDAQYIDVDGFEHAVPQRRERVFVVGYLGDWRRAAAVLFEPESLSGHPAPRREAGQRVAATVAGGARASGGYSTDDIPLTEAFGGGNRSGAINAAACLTAKGQRIDFEVETFIATRDVASTLTRGAESAGRGGYAGRRQEDETNLVATRDVAGTLTSSMGRRNGQPNDDNPADYLVAHSLRAEGFDASEDGTGRGTPLVPVPIPFDTTQITSKANRSVPKAGDPCHPLAAGAHAPAIAFDTYNGDLTGDVTHTLRDGNSEGTPCVVRPGWAVRRLTPLECERLQGFPDGYTAITRKGKPAADGPRYKALGNSMACNVMRWIGRRIEMVDALHKDLHQHVQEAAE